MVLGTATEQLMDSICAEMRQRSLAAAAEADRFCVESESGDYSLMRSDAVTAVEIWRRRQWNAFSPLTNGQLDAHSSTGDLMKEYARLFTLMGVPFYDLPFASMAEAVFRRGLERAPQIEYELLRRGAWIEARHEGR